MTSRAHAIPIAAAAHDAEVAATVKMMRAVLADLPAHKRAAVIAEINSLLPKGPPQRGGDVLNKVIHLFKQQAKEEKRTEWRAADVVSAVKAEPKQVYNALQYLQSRQVIQKKGYGLYVLADGRVIEGAP